MPTTIMALILRRGAKILPYVSTHLQLRSCTTWQSRLSLPMKNVLTHRQCVYRACRNISMLCNPLHCQEPAASLIDEPVVVVEDDVVSRPRQKPRFTSNFKTKSQFMSYFNFVLPADNKVLDSRTSFKLIKSCGKKMWQEPPATRNELVKCVWSELTNNGVRLETALWNTLLSVYLENDYEFEPLDFLKEMYQKSNSEPNNATFSLLIQSYAQRGDPMGAMKIVEFMLKHEEKITEATYGWLVHAFAKSGDMDGVNEIFDSMRRNNIKPRHFVYEQLINAHAANGSIDNIGKVIEQMVNDEVFPTSTTYINILDELVSAGHADHLEQVWEKIDDNEHLTKEIMQLIRKYIIHGDYEAALILKKKSVKMTTANNAKFQAYLEVSLFSTLEYIGRGDINEYLKLSAAVENHLNQPPLSRLKHLLRFLIANGKEKDANELLLSLLSEGKSLTARDFEPLFEAYVNSNNISAIVKLYQLMVNYGIALGSQCHKLLQVALINDKQCSIPLLFRSILVDRSETKVSDKSSSAFLDDGTSSYDLYDSLDEIKSNMLADFNAIRVIDIVSHIHNSGIKVSNLIDVIVKHLLSSENVDDALNFMRTIVSNDTPHFSRSYTIIMQGLFTKRRYDALFSFVQLLKEHNVDLEDQHYFQMLKAASRVRKHMIAEFCFEKLTESNKFTIDNRVYDCLIQAYYKPIDRSSKPDENAVEIAKKIVHIFNEMVEKGHEPSYLTVSSVITQYLFLQDIESANKVIERYGESGGGKLNKETINTALLKAYVAKLDIDASVKLFEEIKASSSPKLSHYNEMMFLFQCVGDTKKAEETYQELLTRDIQPNLYTYKHLIWTFLNVNDLTPCIGFIEESHASGIKLTVSLYMELLKRLVATGNVEGVENVIEKIKQYHLNLVQPALLEIGQIFVNIKAGNLEEASTILHKTEDLENVNIIISNRSKQMAKSAVKENDLQYISNLIDFCKINNYDYKELDIYYAMVLNKRGDLDGIQSFYAERIKAGESFSGKFMTFYDMITQERDL